MQFNLDTSKQICPIPLLKLKLVMRQCQVGDRIIQLVSDKSSVKDIPAWLNKKGHLVTVSQVSNNLFELTIKIEAV